MGMVTATEVGKYKKEIAYHGDVINTAARIQGMCNHFEVLLLVSETLKESLPTNNPLNFIYKGAVSLKGKSEEVGIYSVTN